MTDRGLILVLGGTGFVGKNVVEALRAGGYPVTSISRSEGCDLRDPAATKKAFRDMRPSTIVNCAARVGSLNYVTSQAADVVADNTRMTLSVYEAVVECCPQALVINPIANCAYPGTVHTFEEDRWWDGPLHPSVMSYGSTRRLLWSVAECFQMQHHVRSVHLLVPNMYGPHDTTDPNKAHALNALTAKFVEAKYRNAPEVRVWGTGAAVREWLYAPDFARLILDLIKTPSRVGLSEPTNVGQNFGLSVRELVGLIQRATGYSGQVRYDPSMPDGAPRKVMDDRRFRRIFRDFTFTPLETGVPKTVEYYEGVLRPAGPPGK